MPCRETNLVKREQLGAALATKAPGVWKGYLHPDALVQLKGVEGTCIYTTFNIEGTDEKRILRFAGAPTVEKCFEMLEQDFEAEGISREGLNETQLARMDLLKWTKKTHLAAEAAQINPSKNNWTKVGKIPALDKGEVVSVKIDPEKKRKASDNKGGADPSEFVEQDTFIKVGPKGSYAVVEGDGFVRVTTFKKQKTGDDEDELDEH